jgi:hypothetical protein
MVSTEQGNVHDYHSDSAAQHHQTSYPTSGTRQPDAEADTGGEDVKDRKDGEDMASWAGQPAIKGSTESMGMVLLTFSLIGLQYVTQNMPLLEGAHTD